MANTLALWEFLIEETLLQESDASEEAKKLGLKHHGYGYWEDETGKVVARTIKGKLVKLDPNVANTLSPEAPSTKPTPDVAPQDKKPTPKAKLKDLTPEQRLDKLVDNCLDFIDIDADQTALDAMRPMLADLIVKAANGTVDANIIASSAMSPLLSDQERADLKSYLDFIKSNVHTKLVSSVKGIGQTTQNAQVHADPNIQKAIDFYSAEHPDADLAIQKRLAAYLDLIKDYTEPEFLLNKLLKDPKIFPDEVGLPDRVSMVNALMQRATNGEWQNLDPMGVWGTYTDDTPVTVPPPPDSTPSIGASEEMQRDVFSAPQLKSYVGKHPTIDGRLTTAFQDKFEQWEDIWDFALDKHATKALQESCVKFWEAEPNSTTRDVATNEVVEFMAAQALPVEGVAEEAALSLLKLGGDAITSATKILDPKLMDAITDVIEAFGVNLSPAAKIFLSGFCADYYSAESGASMHHAQQELSDRLDAVGISQEALEPLLHHWGEVYSKLDGAAPKPRQQPKHTSLPPESSYVGPEGDIELDPAISMSMTPEFKEALNAAVPESLADWIEDTGMYEGDIDTLRGAVEKFCLGFWQNEPHSPERITAYQNIKDNLADLGIDGTPHVAAESLVDYYRNAIADASVSVLNGYVKQIHDKGVDSEPTPVPPANVSVAKDALEDQLYNFRHDLSPDEKQYISGLVAKYSDIHNEEMRLDKLTNAIEDFTKAKSYESRKAIAKQLLKKYDEIHAGATEKAAELAKVNSAIDDGTVAPENTKSIIASAIDDNLSSFTSDLSDDDKNKLAAQISHVIQTLPVHQQASKIAEKLFGYSKKSSFPDRLELANELIAKHDIWQANGGNTQDGSVHNAVQHAVENVPSEYLSGLSDHFKGKLISDISYAVLDNQGDEPGQIQAIANALYWMPDGHLLSFDERIGTAKQLLDKYNEVTNKSIVTPPTENSHQAISAATEAMATLEKQFPYDMVDISDGDKAMLLQTLVDAKSILDDPDLTTLDALYHIHDAFNQAGMTFETQAAKNEYAQAMIDALQSNPTGTSASAASPQPDVAPSSGETAAPDDQTPEQKIDQFLDKFGKVLNKPLSPEHKATLAELLATDNPDVAYTKIAQFFAENGYSVNAAQGMAKKLITAADIIKKNAKKKAAGGTVTPKKKKAPTPKKATAGISALVDLMNSKLPVAMDPESTEAFVQLLKSVDKPWSGLDTSVKSKIESVLQKWVPEKLAADGSTPVSLAKWAVDNVYRQKQEAIAKSANAYVQSGAISDDEHKSMAVSALQAASNAQQYVNVTDGLLDAIKSGDLEAVSAAVSAASKTGHMADAHATSIAKKILADYQKQVYDKIPDTAEQTEAALQDVAVGKVLDSLSIPSSEASAQLTQALKNGDAETLQALLSEPGSSIPMSAEQLLQKYQDELKIAKAEHKKIYDTNPDATPDFNTTDALQAMGISETDHPPEVMDVIKNYVDKAAKTGNMSTIYYVGQTLKKHKLITKDQWKKLLAYAKSMKGDLPISKVPGKIKGKAGDDVVGQPFATPQTTDAPAQDTTLDTPFSSKKPKASAAPITTDGPNFSVIKQYNKDLQKTNPKVAKQAQSVLGKFVAQPISVKGTGESMLAKLGPEQVDLLTYALTDAMAAENPTDFHAAFAKLFQWSTMPSWAIKKLRSFAKEDWTPGTGVTGAFSSPSTSDESEPEPLYDPSEPDASPQDRANAVWKRFKDKLGYVDTHLTPSERLNLHNTLALALSAGSDSLALKHLDGLALNTSLLDSQIQDLKKYVAKERKTPTKQSYVDAQKAKEQDKYHPLPPEAPPQKPVVPKGPDHLGSEISKVLATHGLTGDPEKVKKAKQEMARYINTPASNITRGDIMGAFAALGIPDTDAEKLLHVAKTLRVNKKKYHPQGWEDPDYEETGAAIIAKHIHEIPDTAKHADLAKKELIAGEKVKLTGNGVYFTNNDPKLPGMEHVSSEDLGKEQKKWKEQNIPPALLSKMKSAQGKWQSTGQYGYSAVDRAKFNDAFTKAIEGPPPAWTKVTRPIERGLSFHNEESLKAFVKGFAIGKTVYLGPSGFSENTHTPRNYVGHHLGALLRIKPSATSGAIKGMRLHMEGYGGEHEIITGTNKDLKVVDVIKHVVYNSGQVQIRYEIVMEQQDKPELNEAVIPKSLGFNLKLWRDLPKETIKAFIRHLNCTQTGIANDTESDESNPTDSPRHPER